MPYNIAAMLNGRLSPLVIIDDKFIKNNLKYKEETRKSKTWMKMIGKSHYKIMPCPSYQMNGRCDQGKKCILIHKISEARCHHCLRKGKHLAINCSFMKA